MMATQSRSQSIELLIAYYHNPAIKLRNQLVMLNAGLVRQMAHRLSYQCAEPYEDLEQIGYFGLIRAIERFNPHTGCAFSSFAVPYIRGEMLHFLRDKGSLVKIPRRWQELHRQAQKVKLELAATLKRTPQDLEIAQALQVSVLEWRSCKAAFESRSLVSLDATVSQMADCPVTLGDSLPDPHYQALQQKEEERLELHAAMSFLEEKTQAVLELVYIRDLPRKEAASRIGISPMTVTRRLHRGVEQLVSLLHEQTTQRLAS